MINMLLYSEGKTEHGYDEYKKREWVHTDGVIQIYLQKLAGGNFCIINKTRNDIKKFRVIPHVKKYTNESQLKARKIAGVAQQECCKYIACHRDEDNKGFDEVYRKVRDCFTVAEEHGMFGLPIVPMHMTESWLLSDTGAFPSVPNKPALPKKPEKTWGNPDSEQHPKKYIKRVLNQFNLQPSTDTYCEIAEKSNISVIRERCPVSFGRFCDDMKELIGNTN